MSSLYAVDVRDLPLGDKIKVLEKMGADADDLAPFVDQIEDAEIIYFEGLTAEGAVDWCVSSAEYYSRVYANQYPLHEIGFALEFLPEESGVQMSAILVINGVTYKRVDSDGSDH